MTKHGGNVGGKKTRLYSIWLNMRQRCNDPNATSYKYYGAKGIKVLWSSFADFKRDMEPGYADNLTLGRKKNDQHYCKNNCRWETPAQQNRNYSRNIVVEMCGKRQCLLDWSRELRLSYAAIAARVRKGWAPEKALTTPVKSRIRK